MTKLCTLAFSFLVVGFTVYGESSHSYYLSQLISSGTYSSILRIVLISALVSYMFLPRVRTLYTSMGLGALSLVLVAFGFLTLVSPTVVGHLNYYFAVGDSFIFIEFGILASVMVHELPKYESVPGTQKPYTYEPSLSTFQNMLLAGSAEVTAVPKTYSKQLTT